MEIQQKFHINKYDEKLYLLIIFFLFYGSNSAIAEQKAIEVNPIKEASIVTKINTQPQYTSYDMIKNLS